METIVGVMKKVAQQETRKIYTTELGIVTAIFPHKSEDDKDNYQCSVNLKNRKQPDGKEFELRQIPIATPHLGMVNIPNVGDLVLITFIGGDINAPVIIGRMYNDPDQPPLNQENELLIQHSLKEGGSFKIDGEGVLTLTSQDEKTSITVKDQEVIATTDKSSVTFNQGDVTLKNDRCTISVSNDTIAIDNGTCKINIEAAGITIDAASNNVTIKSMGSIKVGDAATGSIQVGGRMLSNAVADNDDIILSMHTHMGNLGAPCPVLVPTEKINSIQAKARNTQVG